jgi:N6-adenosine-specific RNA methylase IME4
MTELLRYDAACRALAEAHSIDEVKDIRDKAEAMRIYARQAQNTELEERAAAIRLRAEKRLGEQLIQAKDAGKLREGSPQRKNGAQNEPLERIRLSDFGIDKRLSVRAQKLGSIAERAFEAMIERTRQAIRDRGSRAAFAELNTQDKKDRRAKRERELGEKQRALPDKKYGVIVADPEWHDEVWSEQTGMDRHAANHYPTSGAEIIAARKVEEISAKDCVLFLWTTNQHLRIAIAVMEAWGFDYKSNYCWGKDRMSLGRWNRSRHELLLIGTRGSPPCPAPGTQRESLILATKSQHSAKPEVFLEMIEQYYPTMPKIELNRRGLPRGGWDAWGYESEQPNISADFVHPRSPMSEPALASAATGAGAGSQLFSEAEV